MNYKLLLILKLSQNFKDLKYGVMPIFGPLAFILPIPSIRMMYGCDHLRGYY